MTEEQLVKIETKIAHQENLIEELNQALAKQQGDIEHLQTVLKLFLKRFSERGDAEAPIGPANEKPPHY